MTNTLFSCSCTGRLIFIPILSKIVYNPRVDSALWGKENQMINAYAVHAKCVQEKGVVQKVCFKKCSHLCPCQVQVKQRFHAVFVCVGIAGQRGKPLFQIIMGAKLRLSANMTIWKKQTTLFAKNVLVHCQQRPWNTKRVLSCRRPCEYW